VTPDLQVLKPLLKRTTAVIVGAHMTIDF